MDLWREPAASTALLAALTGHPTLRKLNISNNEAPDGASAATLGAAIGALLSFNSPVLKNLSVKMCGLNDDAAEFLMTLQSF